MKLKYYIRGLASGILVTTILFLIVSMGNQNTLSDAEVIERAKALGMVEEEETLFSSPTDDAEEASFEEESVEEKKKDSEEQVEEKTDIEGDEPVDTKSDTSNEEIATTEEETAERLEVSTNEEMDASENNEEVQEDTNSEENGNQEITFTIESGLSSKTIANMLAEKGVIEDAGAFHDYIVANDSTTRMNIGEYTVEPGISYQDLLEEITVGDN